MTGSCWEYEVLTLALAQNRNKPHHEVEG